MNDLLLRCLRGEATQRRPLWIMRQAGRYLPEYRALRASASFEELCASPELAAQVTLMPIERFPLDAAIVFADLVSPLAALGLQFRFDPGPVLAKPLRSAAAIRALRVPAAAEIAPEVAATLRLARERLAGRAPLIGFAGAPWSLAAYAVQGAGKSDFPALRALLVQDPATLGQLLETLARLSAAYLLEQARAGAQVLQVFDSWAGLLSLRDWTQHVRPHLLSLLQELEAAGVPRILFVNGAPQLALACAQLPCEALALCWRSDLPELRRTLGPRLALQGNLDPASLLAGPESTRSAALDLMQRMPARAHVLNLGHGILPETPLESVQALIEVVHAERAASASGASA
jgi:uroporphyrinogen decarboxylase